MIDALRELLWDRPSGALSRWTYLRARAARVASLASQPPQPATWRFQDESWLSPEGVDTALLFAPRWNMHGAPFYTHPFGARRAIQLDLGAAARSAELWSVTIRRFGSGPVAHFGPEDAGRGTVTVDVSPGPYMIDGRYYGLLADPVVPDGAIDDAPLQGGRVPVESIQAARAQLLGYRTWTHRLWHHHARIAIRRQVRLGEAAVRSILLPAGDPGTHFSYGLVQRGQALALATDVQDHPGQRALVTVYGAGSFPLAWTELTASHTVLDPAAEPGFWLGRVVGVRAGQAATVSVSAW